MLDLLLKRDDQALVELQPNYYSNTTLPSTTLAWRVVCSSFELAEIEEQRDTWFTERREAKQDETKTLKGEDTDHKSFPSGSIERETKSVWSRLTLEAAGAKAEVASEDKDKGPRSGDTRTKTSRFAGMEKMPK